MRHFPIYLDTRGRRVVLAGGGAEALAKLRLIGKTEAELLVFATDPAPEILAWARAGRLRLQRRAMGPGDAAGAALVYAASGDPAEDARVARLARAAGVPVNRVDHLEGSDFITPAIVDRDPVTVAIGTEGAAPVLARAIKADLEARLPARLGLLARAARAFRPRAEALPRGRARRAFWAEFFDRVGPRAGDAASAQAALESLLARHLQGAATAGMAAGHVDFLGTGTGTGAGKGTGTGTGTGEPDMLTLAARRALDAADVVIHDEGVAPEILELARREALLIEASSRAAAGARLVEHAGAGAHVVRLTADAAGKVEPELAAVQAAGIPWRILPAAAAPVVAMPGRGSLRANTGMIDKRQQEVA